MVAGTAVTGTDMGLGAAVVLVAVAWLGALGTSGAELREEWSAAVLACSGVVGKQRGGNS